MDNVYKLSPTARKVDDHSNIKFKSLFIDMDLAMHRSLNANSPRVRRLRQTLDSHEDFEFDMSHNMFMGDDSADQATEVASADKLFFKGRILPLQGQADPKRQLSQPMASPSLEADYCEKIRNSFQSLHTLNQSWRHYLIEATSENPLEKHASEKDCFTICHNEEMSAPPLQVYSSQHLMYANEEETSGAECALRDGIDIIRSCNRLEFGIFGPDSCSSSFRSHHSNSYWSSAEKDSRDSSSSSRCSNGSHHDSAFNQCIEKKAPPSILSMQLIKASHIPGVQQSELCDIMGGLSLSANPSHPSNHPKPPISASLSSRKWSWKGFFTSLRKASKLWVDDGKAGDAERKNIASKGEKRPVFTFKELPGVLGENEIGYRRSVGHDREWQANTYQFVSREGLMKKGTQHARASWGTLAIRDDCEDQQVGTIYCLRSGGRQEGDAGDQLTSKREKGKVQGNVWSAKESWNSCVIKMKKGSAKLSVSAACKLAPLNKELMESNNMSKNGASRIMKEEDNMNIHRLMKAKSLSSTPLAKSPVRTAEYIAGNNHVGGLNERYVGLYAMQGGAASGLSGAAASAMKKSCNKKVGFAASCPASMRSSPHHSGLLAVVNKATPDLHTAIQGAIAHCKQSQVAAAAAAAATPPP